MFEQFTDRYLPGPTLDGQVDPQIAAEHARMMTGVYQVSRRAESSFFRMLNLASVKVFANDDALSAFRWTNVAGAPVKWREVEPFVWRDADGESLLSAEVVDGRIARFAFEWVSPFMVFEPMPA